MTGTIKYSTEEVEKIILEYHKKIMPEPVGMIWVVIEKSYGGVECNLLVEKEQINE